MPTSRSPGFACRCTCDASRAGRQGGKELIDTGLLIKMLEDALRYEASMERNCPGFLPIAYRPAARDAYLAVLEILRKDALEAADFGRIHARLAEVFEREHYPGIQLEFICSWVDRWLDGHAAGCLQANRLHDLFRQEALRARPGASPAERALDD